MSSTPPVQLTSENWQRRFYSCNSEGKCSRGYYRSTQTGKLYGPIDSNVRLADTPAAILFNMSSSSCEQKLNVWLIKKECALLDAVDQVTKNHVLTVEYKINIAQLLALHASRYPDLFGHPIYVDRHYATVLNDAHLFSNYAAFNAHLRWSGFPSDTYLSAAEFKTLRAGSDNELDFMVDQILRTRRYKPIHDNRVLLLGEFPSAKRLLEFEWELIEAPRDEFIFSDRPVPSLLVSSTIALGISARFGIRLTEAKEANDARSITAQSPKHNEVALINAEVRQRAEKWVCGPDPAQL